MSDEATNPAENAAEPAVDTRTPINAGQPVGEVMVFAEQSSGEIQPVALELLGAGRRLADKLERPLSAIVLGDNLDEAVKTIVAYGADRVYVASHSELVEYRTLPYRRVICNWLEHMEVEPHTMLLGSTTTGRDLAPRIAAHFRTGLTADTTELDIGPYDHKGGSDPTKIGLYANCLYAIRPSFGESLKARILGPWKNPQMATTRPGVMVPLTPDWERQAEIIHIPVDLDPRDFRLQVEETFREVSKGVDLAAADVVISGGYGLGNADGFNLLKQLADCFEHSALGASRKVVDVGWLPYLHQIGQTGKTVRPKVYIACGISGAIQHRVGMQNADVIIAINKDPDAPIFKFAHQGIVGDVYQVVPEMIRQLRDGKSATSVPDSAPREVSSLV